MAFWVCYYHVIWTTKNRTPIITLQQEPIIYNSIRAKSAELDCATLAVNGTSDHVHVVVCIKPSVAVGTWVSQVKGASSHAVNVSQSTDSERFRWQEGYGVLTFGAKNLPFVVSYIENQKTRHTNGKTEPYLERTEQ